VLRKGGPRPVQSGIPPFHRATRRGLLKGALGAAVLVDNAAPAHDARGFAELASVRKGGLV